jgi:hypothetical protein
MLIFSQKNAGEIITWRQLAYPKNRIEHTYMWSESILGDAEMHILVNRA